MNLPNFNKVLNIYTSNEKGLLTNDNANSSENLELDTNVNSSCLYATATIIQ